LYWSQRVLFVFVAGVAGFLKLIYIEGRKSVIKYHKIGFLFSASSKSEPATCNKTPQQASDLHKERCRFVAGIA